ncbi:MAG: SOUL family heme-binding protein [Myxococcota bacterium]
MLYWTIGIVGSLLGVWAGYTHLYEGGLDEPKYQIVEQIGDIEIRRYEPFIIASTQPGMEGDSGLNKGFRTLAGYIFGGNKPNEKLAMTAPVIQQNTTGESIPMTAPVVTSPNSMSMAFVMPTDRTLNDLPTPSSSAVELTEVDWGLMAVSRFSGRGKQARFQETEKSLTDDITRAKRNIRGPALYAQYNSPSAFPPLRRNEVLIPIQDE